MIKTITTAALLALSAATQAQLDLTASVMLPSNEDVTTAPQIKARYGGNVYAHASWSRHDQVMTTQALGGLDMFTAGIGYRESFGRLTPFVEVGVGYLTQRSVKDIVEKEAVFYRFVPTFGYPPFQQYDGFGHLSHRYDLKPDVAATIGARWAVSERLGIEVAYNYFRAPEYFATWNPDWNGGPAAGLFECGCLWHGDGRLDMGSITVGFNYRFGGGR